MSHGSHTAFSRVENEPLERHVRGIRSATRPICQKQQQMKKQVESNTYVFSNVVKMEVSKSQVMAVKIGVCRQFSDFMSNHTKMLYM